MACPADNCNTHRPNAHINVNTNTRQLKTFAQILHIIHHSLSVITINYLRVKIITGGTVTSTSKAFLIGHILLELHDNVACKSAWHFQQFLPTVLEVNDY